MGRAALLCLPSAVLVGMTCLPSAATGPHGAARTDHFLHALCFVLRLGTWPCCVKPLGSIGQGPGAELSVWSSVQFGLGPSPLQLEIRACRRGSHTTTGHLLPLSRSTGKDEAADKKIWAEWCHKLKRTLSRLSLCIADLVPRVLRACSHLK